MIPKMETPAEDQMLALLKLDNLNNILCPNSGDLPKLCYLGLVCPDLLVLLLSSALRIEAEGPSLYETTHKELKVVKDRQLDENVVTLVLRYRSATAGHC